MSKQTPVERAKQRVQAALLRVEKEKGRLAAARQNLKDTRVKEAAKAKEAKAKAKAKAAADKAKAKAKAAAAPKKKTSRRKK